ncbi:WD repeat-containing protein Grip71 [Musca autumnalis]|uniref:WD repeat-containing protein Grip71 n=1 Tax=Musca autumnalis TaxID=221902 RepID=UPI003CF64EC9
MAANVYLVSTAKTTILTDFNNLETKSTYQHSNGENTDFQFYAQQRIFVEVNKKSGLEIMRVKEKAQKIDLQRVRKLTIDNVYCVACAKQSMEEMAVGLSNGQVKLYNYHKSEFVHKFSADSNRNSVLYLDYNASDEYIASVFENGLINIYGQRTKTKIDSFNIDSNSTLARFHPTKRFQLSIASYKGAVTIYDVHTKRKVFHAADAHGAQCRDLCMSPASPDTLISVGYDCVINIFDTRRKVKPSQLSYCHPLSTVAASECGNYICVGNLKGELTTYDLRNTKAYLSSKKIHDVGVTRVAFVPMPGDNSAQSFSSSSVGEISGLATGANKSVAQGGVGENTRSHRDSFCDFLDFHANRGQEKMSPRFVPRRDSFDWEALSRKPTSDENRFSLIGKVGGIGAALPNISITPSGDSFDARVNTSDFLKARDRSNSPISPLTGKLSQIKEEEKGNQESSHESSVEGESDKENPQTDMQFMPHSRLKPLPVNFNSTPNRNSMDGILTASNRPLLTSTVGPANRKQSTAQLSSNDSTCVQQALNDLRNEMLERFSQLEFEIKLQNETNKWQIFTQNFNLWNQRSEEIEEIRDCLGVLLQTDPFVNEFLRLKEENEMLKLQLLQQTNNQKTE